MKRFAILTFALVLAACGGKSKPATTPANTTEQTEAAPTGGGAETESAADDEGGAKPGPDQTDPCGGDE